MTTDFQSVIPNLFIHHILYTTICFFYGTPYTYSHTRELPIKPALFIFRVATDYWEMQSVTEKQMTWHFALSR